MNQSRRVNEMNSTDERTGAARRGRQPMKATLTPRERDVVRGIVAGRSNRERAHELGLTEQAIKNVLSTIYHKCSVRNRLQLALFAVRNHLASDSWPPTKKKCGRGPRELPHSC